MKQTSGMKLYKFHIRHAATGAPAHGHPVAGGDVGVGGVEINLAQAARRKHGVRRGDSHYFSIGFVEHVNAVATLLVAAQAFAGDEIDGDVMLE